jgi:hypothetical protein
MKPPIFRTIFVELDIKVDTLDSSAKTLVFVRYGTPTDADMNAINRGRHRLKGKTVTTFAVGFAFLIAAFFVFLIFGNVAIGIVFLALGVVFIVNGGRYRAALHAR